MELITLKELEKETGISQQTIMTRAKRNGVFVVAGKKNVEIPRFNDGVVVRKVNAYDKAKMLEAVCV